MNKQLTRMGMVILVIVLAFGAIGTAAAQGPGQGDPQPQPQGPARPNDRVMAAIIQAFGDATGLTWDDVLPDLRDGATLNDIFVAQGLDPVAVADQVKAEITAEVQAKVDAGDITQAQGDRVIAGLDDALDRVMNNPLPPQNDRPQPVRDAIAEAIENSLLGTASEMLGMEPREVMQAWREAGSLAAVLTAHGVDVDAVLDATVANVTTQVNGAVANGRLNEEQAATILEGLRDRLVERVNHTLPVSEAVRQRIAQSFDVAMLQALADMAGVEPGDILREALTPPSLADVATELGLDPDAVIVQAEAKITEAVNEMVANGVITEAEAAQLLDGLHDRLVDRFNQPIRMPQQRQNQRQGQGGQGQQGPNNQNAQPPATDGAGV
jgi:uncharacterized protein YidB (DUF937 family)/uncharacterized protein (DUF2267 family)